MSWKLMWATALVLGGLVVALRYIPDDPGTATWDISRASGFVAYVLLWATVFTGAGVNLRFHPPIGRQAIAMELHRISAVLAFSFVVVHLLGLFLDPFIGFGLTDVLVGVTADYRPMQSGLGALAAWGLVSLLVSVAYSASIRTKWWRAWHYGGYAVWALALIHGLLAGSDTEHWPTHLLYSATTGALGAALVIRFFGREWVTHPPPGQPG